jgi:hypothetical protein
MSRYKGSWNFDIVTITPYSTQQSSSWGANRFVASQKIPRVSLNLKVHYRIHNCSPPISILSQPNPVHTPTSPAKWEVMLNNHEDAKWEETVGVFQQQLQLAK